MHLSPIHHSLIHSFTLSPFHPFTHSPIHPFTHSPFHPFTLSPIHVSHSDSFRHLGPTSVLAGALQARFDKGDPFPTILDVRVFGAVAVEGFAGSPLAHVRLEAAVQARVGIVKGLRVARRHRSEEHT